jgi:hypothetical protein
VSTQRASRKARRSISIKTISFLLRSSCQEQREPQEAVVEEVPEADSVEETEAVSEAVTVEVSVEEIEEASEEVSVEATEVASEEETEEVSEAVTVEVSVEETEEASEEEETKHVLAEVFNTISLKNLDPRWILLKIDIALEACLFREPSAWSIFRNKQSSAHLLVFICLEVIISDVCTSLDDHVPNHVTSSDEVRLSADV